MTSIFIDWRVNAGDVRIQCALVLFRAARRLRTSRIHVTRILGKLLCLVYLVVVEWTWGLELPWATVVGPRLRIYHGTGIVINAGASLGADIVLRQGVCIGARASDGKSPIVGNSVQFGANSIALGNIKIGSGAIIGAGAVLLIDVPEGMSAVGNPARII